MRLHRSGRLDTEQYGDIPAYTEMWVEGYMRVLDGAGEVHSFDLAPGRYRLAIELDASESSTVDVSAATEP